MSATEGGVAGGTRFDPLLLPRVMIWSVLAAILSYTVADPDLWGNIRLGLDIIDLRGFPASDPYSFTSDRPWTNHEWLAEVVIAAAFLAGGPPAVSALKLVLLLLTFALVLHELSSRGLPSMAQDIVLALAVIGCLALTKTIRPQTFSIFLFTCLLVTLRRVEDGRVQLLWLVPPMAALWANLHGGWLVGIGVLGLWTAIRILAPMGASRLTWAVAGLLALMATLANAHGIGIWQFLWQTVGLGRADISEWQPLTGLPIVDALPWGLTTLVALIGLRRAQERRATHLAVVVLLMFVSFRVMRVVPFYALAVAVLVGPHVVRKTQRRAQTPPPTPVGALVVVGSMALAFVGASAVASYRNLSCIPIPADDWVADQPAAAYIRAAGLSGRLLTWFDWGHYAIWFLTPQIQVSMDGRRETVYSDATIRRHLAVYYGWPRWEEDLSIINPDHIWLPNRLSAVDAIAALGWQRVFQSAKSTVLTRTATSKVPFEPRAAQPCFPGEP